MSLLNRKNAAVRSPDEDPIFQSRAYRSSRMAYIWQCAFEYFVTILVGDAFLAKLLHDIGMEDSTIGVISSLISLAFLFQLFSVFVVQRVRNTKRFVTVFSTASQLFFMCLYLVPFLPMRSEYRSAVVVACVMLAYFGNYFVTSMIYKWGNSFVAPTSRARFSSTKEMISLITGMAFTLIIGKVIDCFEAAGNLKGGFLLTAAVIFVLSIANLTCLLRIKNQVKSPDAQVEPLSDVIKNTLGNRNFRNVIIMTVLWQFAIYLTMGFLGIYKTKDLLISVGTVQVINVVGNLARFFVSRPFGRFSDKTSFATGISLAYAIAALAFLVNAFTTPKTWWLIIVYTVLYFVSMAGSNQNSFNIVYSYVPERYFVQATAIKNSIGGVVGFGASLLGSRILQTVQQNGNMLFGIPVYGQQVLSGLTFLLIVADLIFVRCTISKQKVMVQ